MADTKKSKKKTAKTATSSEEATQPVMNIGLVGHVDHGKTTLTEKLTGKWTDTHSEELKRGITIRLGYADVTFRKIKGKKAPDCYTTQEKDEKGNPTELIRKVSFVDAPGHESLMATMLAGATIMDGALLLIAANETCPQPQTAEHLKALEISGIKNIIVVQNKIDLVSKERALRNHQQIKEFLKGTPFEEAPIIPISAAHDINLDLLIESIETYLPTPERKNGALKMLTARSFDINKPGIPIKKLNGGVLGGAIVSGTLKTGQEIEIRPGRILEEHNKITAKSIITKVTSAMTGGVAVEELHPGGSVAAMTTLDPGIVKGDSLSGSVVGIPGKLPPIWTEFTLKTTLLERVVGADEDIRVDNIKLNEVLMLNVNSAATVGLVDHISKDKVHCKLKVPVCADTNDRVTISRRIGARFRLIGYGEIAE